MTTSSPGRDDDVKLVEFGQREADYVREQLAFGSRQMEGPLAQRLRSLPLASPFALLSREAAKVAVQAQDVLESGIGDRGKSDELLYAAIHSWLNTGDPGRERRLLCLEEALGRSGDPVHVRRPRSLVYGDRVYFVADETSDRDAVRRALYHLSDYPGLGILTIKPWDVDLPRLLDDRDLDALRDAAVAVLVRAWDGEGFLIAPVNARLTPADLVVG